MKDFRIRGMERNERVLLKSFLYEAIFQRNENNLLSCDVIEKPELKIFIDRFGEKPDDHCLVAECEGKVVGAVWTRVLDGTVKGYGHVDSQTPEFAISLYKPYRNLGIGTALMKSMLDVLRGEGYQQASLAVQKDNYAVKMYETVGFYIVAELEEEFLMICRLNQEVHL